MLRTCDPTTYVDCTDHACFEPYHCTCQSGHLDCQAGIPFCADMARRATD